MSQDKIPTFKVLLVEDSPTEAMIIQASLEEAEEEQFDIVHATELAQTLGELAARSFDIVVLDLTLPDSSGINTFVRVHENYPDIPIVILTANRNRNMAVQSVEMGAQDYIVKEQVENMQLVLSIRYAIMRSKAEARQKALLNELARVNKELESFAYIVSHDLKAPLRGIRTVVDWLMADYGDNFDEDGKEQLSLLTGRVDRMHSLIDGVLSYSRAGRKREAYEQIDLNQLILEIIDTLVPPENIKFTVAPNLPILCFEATHITQLFQNLISNSVKYMDKDVGEVKIDCLDQGDMWQFSVSDNGAGIPEKQYERIFEMFTTLKSKDEYESTGVGLPIVKKILDSCGGKIWVESVVGEGSTFYVAWPKDIQAEEAQEPQPELATSTS